MRIGDGLHRPPVAPRHGARHGRLSTRAPLHAGAVHPRQIILGHGDAADVGTQPGVGAEPSRDPQVGRDIEQQARRAAHSAIGDFVARGGRAVRGVGKGARGDDARRAREPMQPESQCKPVVQPGCDGDTQIGDGAVARDLISDRLLHAAQIDRVLDDHAEGAVEVGREAAAHNDAARDGPRDHHRREASPTQRRLQPTGIDGAPRRTARHARTHAPHVGQHGIRQRRKGVERRECATRGPRPHALPFAGCSQPSNTELGILGGESTCRPDGRQQRHCHDDHGRPAVRPSDRH